MDFLFALLIAFGASVLYTLNIRDPLASMSREFAELKIRMGNQDIHINSAQLQLTQLRSEMVKLEQLKDKLNSMELSITYLKSKQESMDRLSEDFTELKERTRSLERDSIELKMQFEHIAGSMRHFVSKLEQLEKNSDDSVGKFLNEFLRLAKAVGTRMLPKAIAG